MRLHANITSAWLRHAFLLLGLMLQACATQTPHPGALAELDRSALPPSNVSVQIPGLGPCTDNPDRTLHFNSREPVLILTHGCFGSSGQFRALSQVMAFQGQQAMCFTYDDRASLNESASLLNTALTQLTPHLEKPQVTVIGHSQGALIARRALTEPVFTAAAAVKDSKLDLVTISGPFAGIEAASPCGSFWVNFLTLGTTRPLCRIVTGAKYADITYASRFIREPGSLHPRVSRYLKIDTDERDSCRRSKDGRCVQDDYIFSLAEQYFPPVDRAPRTQVLTLKAGHVEIVGDHQTAPMKLISALQAQGVIRSTPPARSAAFRAMLARTYRDASLVP